MNQRNKGRGGCRWTTENLPALDLPKELLQRGDRILSL